MLRRSVRQEVAVAATKVKKLEPLRNITRHHSVLFPRLTKLAEACRAVFGYHAKVLDLRAQSTKFMRSTPSQSNNVNRSAALNALLLSALALPGMVGTAHASSDDVVKGTTAKVNTLPSLDDTARPDEDQEIGIQYSHYMEGARNLIGPVTTGIIPATAGSPITGTTTGIGNLPKVAPIKADGEHAYARFRIGDRSRIGFDFVQDVWSGASSTATLPSSIATIAGATISALSSYFNAQGKPVYQTQYQANANPNTPSGRPQKLVYSPDTQMGHVIGYASPEARKQTTFKYGYDWDDASIDVGAGVSGEVDFLSRFGNVSLKRDLNEKRTSINMGLSYTQGATHAEWNANGRAGSFALDAYPGQFTQYNIPGQMVGANGGLRMTYKAPLITGDRNDVSLTGGVTQVVNKNDILSSGFGYTHTTGFLSNPWKGALVFFPGAPDPSVLATYPSISNWTGQLELEHRPSLRNQFTWDTSYLHYFDHKNAAGQLHYSLFVDSWGIIAHTVDGEWRQSLGNNWIVTPRLRYYTQSAANFYAPYFFALSATDLPNHYFSSDERLSGFGTITPGITITKKLTRGLKLETGVEYSARSGSFKMGGNEVGSYADLHSYTFNIALRGSLDGSGAKSNSSLSLHAMNRDEQIELPNGKMDGMTAHNMPNQYISSEHSNIVNGKIPDMHDMTTMDMSGMSHQGNANGSITEHTSKVDGPDFIPHEAMTAHAEQGMHMSHHNHADAPAGVMSSHMMDEPGSVMVGYLFEQQREGGTLMHGSQVVPFDITKNANSITEMTMNMNMVEVMYAQNDWLNWMIMPQLVSSKMGMFMNDVNNSTMSMNMMRMRSYMASGGVGDTSVAALVRLWDNAGHHIHTTQEISIPTGSVNIRQDNISRAYPFDMQTGSGTWDWKPSLTYTGSIHNWSWGGQLGGIVRLQNHNSSGYALGDELHVTAWAGYQILPWLTATLRPQYTDQSKISGGFNDPNGAGAKIQETLPSDADPANYGGRYTDLGIGFSAHLGNGAYANDKISIEWLKPIKTDFNGSQPNRVGTLFLSGKFMF